MKKFLASVLVFAMMLSMCAFTVSADEVAETPFEPLLVTGTTFDKLANGAVYTSGMNFTSEEGAEKRIFYARSEAKDAETNFTAVTEGDRKYITSTRYRMGYNFDETGAEAQARGFGTTYDTFHVSYEMNVPKYDASTSRFFSLQFGCTDLATKRPATYAVRVHAKGDSFSVEDYGGDLTAYFNRTAPIKNGEWQKVDIYAYLNADMKIDVCVTVDDKVMYVANGKTKVVGMGSGMNDFYSDQKPTNYDTIKFWYEAGGADIVAAKKAEADAIIKAEQDAEAEELTKTPYVEILKFSGANLESTAGTSAKAVFTSTGALTTSIVQGGDTDDHSAEAYAVIEDANGNYTNLTSTSYKFLPGNVRESFTKWLQKGVGDKSTFVYSTDMKVSNFNANVLGRFTLGLDMMSNDVKDKDGNVILKANKSGNASLIVNIGTDGKIEISNEVAEKHDYGIPSAPVAGAKRSEKRDVTAGEWFNVKIVFEITHGETQYEIKVYGIFEDDVIFEDEFTITYTDYDKDGFSDDIHIGQFDYLIGKNDKTHAETVTSFKSMTFTKDNNFDWSEINKDAWINRKVELTFDVDGNVDVEASKKEGTFTSGVLLVALYDANGSVIELISEENITEGKFVYEVPAAKVATAKKIKAFVFDTITTAVPLFPHGVLVID